MEQTTLQHWLRRSSDVDKRVPSTSGSSSFLRQGTPTILSRLLRSHELQLCVAFHPNGTSVCRCQFHLFLPFRSHDALLLDQPRTFAAPESIEISTISCTSTTEITSVSSDSSWIDVSASNRRRHARSLACIPFRVVPSSSSSSSSTLPGTHTLSHNLCPFLPHVQNCPWYPPPLDSPGAPPLLPPNLPPSLSPCLCPSLDSPWQCVPSIHSCSTPCYIGPEVSACRTRYRSALLDEYEITFVLRFS